MLGGRKENPKMCFFELHSTPILTLWTLTTLGKICYMTLCSVLWFYFESMKLQGLLQGNSHNKSETLQITDYTLHKRHITCVILQSLCMICNWFTDSLHFLATEMLSVLIPLVLKSFTPNEVPLYFLKHYLVYLLNKK